MPELDQHAVRELQLFIENDYELYQKFDVPLVKKLVKAKKKGTFSREKAIAGYMRFATAGAKKYAREFGGTWNKKFPYAVRRKVAENSLDYFEGEYKLGNY